VLYYFFDSQCSVQRQCRFFDAQCINLRGDGAYAKHGLYALYTALSNGPLHSGVAMGWAG